METKKITPQELIQRLRERAAKTNIEGKATTLSTQHSEFIKKLRERAEKAKTEGKSANTMPMAHREFFAKLRERAMLNAESLKKVEVNETEKKEE